MKLSLTKQSLFAASVITIGMSVAGRATGFVREAIVAGYYGTGSLFELFVISFTLPELLTFILFVSVPTALVQILSGEDSPVGKKNNGKIFYSGLISITGLSLVLLLLIFVMRHKIVLWIAPDLSAEELSYGTRLIALLMWVLLFKGIESYFRGWLYAYKHFITPSLSPILINAVIGIVIIGLYGRYDIMALCYGWLAGSFLGALVNGVTAFRLVRPNNSVTFITPFVKRLFISTGAIAVVELLALLYPVVDRMFATRLLGEGQIAALRYAVFLIHIPTGMFVVSFGIASFPWLTELSSEDSLVRFRSFYIKNIRRLLIGMALVATGCYFFSENIVAVTFRRGVFDVSSVRLTATAMSAYAVGIAFYSALLFQIRVYYARKELKRLAFILILMLVLKLCLSALLIQTYEHVGLAIATSITWIAGFVGMSYDITNRTKARLLRELSPDILKVFVVLSVTSILWYALSRLWPGDVEGELTGQFIRLVIIGSAGVGSFLALCRLLHLSDFDNFSWLLKSGRRE